MMKHYMLSFVVLAAALSSNPAFSQMQSSDGLAVTAVPGVRVGHAERSERPTGCTVVLFPEGAVGGVSVQGAAPGTRETDLLDPMNSVEVVHAIVLSGGSAFGLASADGVMRFLEERGIGFDVGVARVPIVPAAILFDLGVGGRPDVRPDAECGYSAAASASTAPPADGNVGAGAGATVGKLLGFQSAMKSGIGDAAIELPNGLIVGAVAAVNAAGDVVDPETGEIVAGARGEDGTGFADVRVVLREGGIGGGFGRAENTTLAVVVTNARLTKAQVNKIAQMAHDGFARTIYPVHTPVDGDVIFAVATGSLDIEVSTLTVGAIAADVVQQAVLKAVLSAESLPGLPAAADHR